MRQSGAISNRIRVKRLISNDPYHYPPELLSLLVETLPLLCRSKRDLLTFFRGCGVAESAIADLQQKLEIDRNSVNKYEIARTVLMRLNEGGDRSLRQRREVIRRVTEYEDFSTCWPDDQLKARGLVSEVRRVVNVKDSFTRIQQERDRERQERASERRQATEALQQRRLQSDALRRQLIDLMSMTNPQQRGTELEKLLNKIFALDGMSIREAFTIRREDGTVGEQIDGLIELAGQPYLVEAKWHNTTLGINEVSRHLVRLFSRSGINGLIISASSYTDAAVDECRRALSQRIIILAEVQELLLLLERNDRIDNWLRSKVLAATVDRNPLYVSS